MYSSEAFETLAFTAGNLIGTDWRFLARWLFSSIDEADTVVSQIEHRTRELKDLGNGVIVEWKKAFGDQGRAGRLLAALHQLQRRDIIDETHLLDDCENYAEIITSRDEEGSAESVLDDAIKRVLLLTCIKVRDNEWRMLHRRLPGGGSEDVVVAIDHDIMELREKTYTMLRDWRNKAVEGATFNALITGLQAIGRQDLAGDIKDICHTYAVDMRTSMQTRRVTSSGVLIDGFVHFATEMMDRLYEYLE